MPAKRGWVHQDGIHRNMEISRSELLFTRKLGEGHTADVYQGTVYIIFRTNFPNFKIFFVRFVEKYPASCNQDTEIQ